MMIREKGCEETLTCGPVLSEHGLEGGSSIEINGRICFCTSASNTYAAVSRYILTHLTESSAL